MATLLTALSCTLEAIELPGLCRPLRRDNRAMSSTFRDRTASARVMQPADAVDELMSRLVE